MPTSADRLLLLADHIKLSLLERSRAISLKLEPNTADAYITRSLETLRQGIEQVEQEQTRMEEHGEVSSKTLREHEDVLVKLRSQYDQLTSQFQNTPDSAANSKSPIDLSNVSSRTALDPNTLPYTDEEPDVADARESLMGRSHTSNLDASMRKSKQVRFSDTLVDADEISNHQVMQLHQRIMEEQDESLDRLSHSITRQRELSIQIGDELDSQGDILDELDEGVDRTHRRITGARKRLDTVARKAKDNGSLITIAVLIVVLILLIVLLK
ncbi:Syntaxin-61 [Dactylella cylindrospora]|nr:Syntaxin-61 [Dactylella cylindrospora]